MTALTKPVRRTTTLRPDWRSPIPVVVTIEPDWITLRQARHRKGYRVPLITLWNYAAKLEADRLRAEKAAKRKGRAA